MNLAIAEAEKALAMGEVPIGAVIVKGGQVIAAAHNLTETEKDPTAHAEMLAIREATKKLGTPRLTGCNMYVTVEPCSMCAGALVWARVEKLFIGTMDPKAGACGSILDITDNPKFNHRINVDVGIMEEECRGLMQKFFDELRLQSDRGQQ